MASVASDHLNLQQPPPLSTTNMGRAGTNDNEPAVDNYFLPGRNYCPNIDIVWMRCLKKKNEDPDNYINYSWAKTPTPIISGFNLYEIHPRELWDRIGGIGEGAKILFYMPRQIVDSKGKCKRQSRSGKIGHWRSTGKKKVIRHLLLMDNATLGYRRKFAFYVGNGTKTEYLMYEYQLDDEEFLRYINERGNKNSMTKMDNKLVICEVFKAREVFKLPEQEIVSYANACVNDGYRFEFGLIVEDFCQQEFQTLDEIFKYACSSSSSKGGKALEPSKDVIETDLFMHQKYGLGWLYHRENSDELPPFWVENKQRGSYKHLLTKIHTNQRPEPLRGGIFADDMGLGKTLTLLSLISTDFCAPLQSLSENLRKEEDDELTLSLSLAGKRTSDTKKRKYSREIVDSSHTNKKVKKIVDFNNLFPDEEEDEIIPKGWWGTRRKTLIICPQSHLSDWTKQLDQHTKPGILRALTYAPDWRKPGRNINSSDNENFQEYDVVLTTDETLVHQSLVPFKDIEWHRVVLDEAHLIYTKENYRRAASALKFRLEAVPFLKTKIVWLVTGMPILNDSYNLLFAMDLLRFEPFSDAKYWNVLVQKLLDKGCKNGISRLQDLTSNICLRRLKEDGRVKLMPKTVETCFVDFSDEEREEYAQVEADSHNVIRNYMNHGRIVGNYASMLGIIQRLRQLCNHSASCPTETLSAYTIEDVTRNPKLLQTMVSILQDEDCFDCPICISPLCKATITCCAHVFCEKCILKYLLTKQKKKKDPCCPMCRHPLSKTDLFSGSPENPCNGSEDNGFAISTSGGSGATIYSSKVSALLNLLVASKNENMSTKSVVFSQFRKMLILLEEPLKAAGFQVVRLDDHMKSTRKRNKLVEEFENMNSTNSHIVLLADHKASDTCINLTFATRAYLLEPWCNPIVEDQAINRLHRIGRQQEIKITRLITKNSIEERIMQLHEWKKNLRSESCAENMDKRQIHREEFRILMAL